MLVRVEEWVWSAVRVGVCVLGALRVDVDVAVMEWVIQLAVTLGVELRDTSVLDDVGDTVRVRVVLLEADADGVDEMDTGVLEELRVQLGLGE